MLQTRCREHWKELGLKDEGSLKSYIKALFDQYSNQQEVLIEIYKLVFPEWDSIKQINGYPKAGPLLWEYICKSFIKFDQRHHPNVFTGGLWFNLGFSVNHEINPWSVSFEDCCVEYITEEICS